MSVFRHVVLQFPGQILGCHWWLLTSRGTQLCIMDPHDSGSLQFTRELFAHLSYTGTKLSFCNSTTFFNESHDFRFHACPAQILYSNQMLIMTNNFATNE